MGSRRSRGQIFSTDLLLALFIFSLITAIFFSTWQYNKNRLTFEQNLRRLEVIANTVSEILVKTPGSPVDWETDPNFNNLTSIGLAKLPRHIDPAKLSTLPQVPADQLKDVLGIEHNEVLIELKTIDGNTIRKIGTKPASEYSVTVRRIVSYEGGEAILRVTVWGDRNYAGVML
ncbi:hypothetical protein ACFLRF_01385 [Candidatus Altiarchaeota archaeon]